MTRYDEMLARLPKNTYRVGDVITVYGKPRLVVFSQGGLITTGNGRGYRKHWTVNQVEGLVVRNFKLKPGKAFNGVTG